MSVQRLSHFLILLSLAAISENGFSQKIDTTILNSGVAGSVIQNLTSKLRLGDSIKGGTTKAETTIDRASLKIQSLQSGFLQKYDSLKGLANHKRFKDSINIQYWANDMREKVLNKISLDSLGFVRKIDGLKTLGLPARRYRKKLDSLKNKKTELVVEISGKQKELQQKVSKRYDGWTKGIGDKFKLDSIGMKFPGNGLTKSIQGELKDPLSEIGMPNMDGLPDVNGLPNTVGLDIPAIPGLSDNDFANLNLSRDLVDTGGDISLPSMDQLHQWDQSIPSIGGLQGRINEYSQMLKDPSKAAENAVGQIGAVSEVSKELAQAEQLKHQNEALHLAEKMKNADSMRDEARKLASAEAVNHFKGQEATLQKAMDEMAKYKKKYSSLGTLSEIKKKDWLPRNGLKSRPFRERFRIGLHSGVQNMKDTLVVDFYPNASYKITGRLEMGAGAIYRIREVKSSWTLDQRNPVWGLAGFGIFKTFKSTYLRVEVDGNSYAQGVDNDAQPVRAWRWSFLAGTQTNFKISKSVTGNVQMLFNFDRKLKDAFPEALTVRFGVQYKLRAKKER